MPPGSAPEPNPAAGAAVQKVLEWRLAMKVAHRAPMRPQPVPAQVLVLAVELRAALLAVVPFWQHWRDGNKARKSVPPAPAIKPHP